MVTKLRSSKLFRFIGVVLVALSTTFILCYLLIILNFDYRNVNNFYETYDFHRYVNDQKKELFNILDLYKGKEKSIPIKAVNGDDLITQEEVKLKLAEENRVYEEKSRNNNNRYDDLKREAIYKKYDERVLEIEEERARYEKEIKKQYFKTEDMVKADLIKDRLSLYNCTIESLPNIKYLIITEDDKVLTNLKYGYSKEQLEEQKKENNFFMLIRQENINDILSNNESSYTNQSFESFIKNNSEMITEFKNKKIKLFAVFMKDKNFSGYMYENKKSFDFYINNKYTLELLCKISIVTLAFGIFIVLFSKVKNKGIIEKIYSKLYIELQLLIEFIALSIVFTIIEQGLPSFRISNMQIYYSYIAFIMLVIILEYYLLVYFINSIRDIVANKNLKEKILVYKLFRCIKNKIKDILVVKSTGFKFILFSIVTAIFFLMNLILAGLNKGPIMVLGLVYFGALFLYGFRFTKHLNKIIDGTSKIGEGDLNHIIDEKGVGILSKLAKNINGLKVGLKDALGKEMKSERMKSELITNVSHDLKTPLTSIINYVDLLKKEDLTPEKANDYVEILDRKSQRLKSLIEDLFEASKATSGAMEMNIEKIEITELLNQTLAEFEEKIVDSKLDFKVNLGTEKVYVMGDGRRTYRVFENLIQNILKYSLANTRVYIDLVETKSEIRLSMKNISAYEMNFNVDEIAERFKRGDLSRNTEGSGLGLAIAKSIMELQNGKLELEIDGDLFKSVILFNK